MGMNGKLGFFTPVSNPSSYPSQVDETTVVLRWRDRAAQLNLKVDRPQERFRV